MSKNTDLVAYGDGMVCESCGEAVRVIQQSSVGLMMQCDCTSKARSMKVKRAIPRSWSQ